MCLLLVPLAVRTMCPPELGDTARARAFAKEKLNSLGPLSRDEKWMAAAIGCTVALWVLGHQLHVVSRLVLMGICD